MVPLLSLGMPFGAITALMMAAMMVYGVQPGPLLMTDHPEIFWGVIASMLIGNVMLLALNIPMISVWVSLLRIPSHILLTMILLVAVIGSFSVRNSILDVYILLFIGLIGYVFRKLDFQLAPLVVGVVLGPLIEKHMREALFMSRGDLLVYVSSPIAIGIWILVILIMVPQIKDSLLRKLFIGRNKSNE
jgi:putative tricarboxylic transport membrane protein